MPVVRKTYGRILKTKTKDLGHGVVEVVVATNTKDRHGEILDIKGLNIKDYSGVVLLNHDYSSLPVGKSLGVRKKTDGNKDYLVSKTQFAIDEYPVANTTYKLVAGGYMPDVSVGFIPEQWDESTGTWTKSLMVEYSHVSIGANPDAKVTSKGLKELGLSQDDFEHQIRDHVLQMKEIEDAIDEAETAFPDVNEDIAETNDELHSKIIDNDDKTIDNVRKYLELAISAISDTERTLDELPSDTESDKKIKNVKKRILLIRARKSINSIDRIAELATAELNRGLKDD